MRPRDILLYQTLEQELINYSNNERELVGVASPQYRDILIQQIIDSMRRVEYVYTISDRAVCSARADPSSEMFDPLKASVYFRQHDQIEEAFWLAFLTVHFGKSGDSGWRLARDIYGRLREGSHWTWERTSSNPAHFSQWLRENYQTLRANGPIGSDGVVRKFGNHRKYETLKSSAERFTGAVFESYVNWVGPARSHVELIQTVRETEGSDPRAMFGHLYNSMDNVVSFGRTGRFDYLTMLSKLGLASIEPGLTYMQGATGPRKGASLLYSGSVSAQSTALFLEELLVDLEANLSIGRLGMQVLEDALCNWQKSPEQYVQFSG